MLRLRCHVVTMVMLFTVSSEALVFARAPPSPLLRRATPMLRRAATPIVMRHERGRARMPAAATTPAPTPKPWWRRALKQLVMTTSIVGAAVALRAPGAVSPACAAAKKATTTSRKSAQPSAGQQALSTIAFGGGLAYWGWASAAKEDKEEAVRIKKETEKLDIETKEFTDIDGDVIASEDLMAALKKRIGNSTDASGGPDANGPSEGSSDGGGAATLDRPPSDPVGGGGAATLEPPESGSPSDPEPTPGASPEDIERLKRMFGSSDDA